MTPTPLAGRRILLIEDEFYQARDVKELVERAGAQVVGPAAHEVDVPHLLNGGDIDAAIVDINLGLGASFETAYLLQRSNVPFLFLTGYDQQTIPDDLSAVPRLEKPVDEKQVLGQLGKLTGQAD